MNARLRTIAAANGGTYGGCWDVVAWTRDAAGGHRLVFAESKRKGSDRIRPTQLRWHQAALACDIDGPQDRILEGPNRRDVVIGGQYDRDRVGIPFGDVQHGRSDGRT